MDVSQYSCSSPTPPKLAALLYSCQRAACCSAQCGGSMRRLAIAASCGGVDRLLTCLGSHAHSASGWWRWVSRGTSCGGPLSHFPVSTCPHTPLVLGGVCCGFCLERVLRHECGRCGACTLAMVSVVCWVRWVSPHQGGCLLDAYNVSGSGPSATPCGELHVEARCVMWRCDVERCDV